MQQMYLFSLLLKKAILSAILESMACGTPVIASTAGGNPESIQDGLNGFLISIGNSQDLCHKMETILKDDYVYNSFSKKCIEVYSEF